MSALKKPIKINVIDEDSPEGEKKKAKKSFEKKELKGKKTTLHVKNKSNKNKKGLKKKEKEEKTLKIAEVKKEKKEAAPKKEEKKSDLIDDTFAKVNAVKNAIMSSSSKKDEEEVFLDSEESGRKSKEIKNEQTDYSPKESLGDIMQSSLDSEQKEQEAVVIHPKDGAEHGRSIKMYRKIAFGFLASFILLIVALSYFSFVRITITLIPNQERVNSNMIFDVYGEIADASSRGEAVNGIVEQVRTVVEDEYDASGEKILGQETIGTVTIYNNHNKNQPLVATTRLLPASDPNKMFRTNQTVNVPAGGSVEVDIYADSPGPDMEIDADKFTIPGLWAGLQDKIYAESKDATVYRQKVEKYVSAEDIENSRRYLKQKLLENMKSKIDLSYADYGEVIYKIDENSIVSNIEAEMGEKTDSFSIEMSANVVVVAFDSKMSADLAQQKFSSSLSDNKEMLSFDRDNIIYSLNNYNLNDKTAAINATFEGRISLREESDIVDKEKIVGLNKQQLDAYLKNLPDIAGYEVKFQPPFINRIPKLIEPSKIKVEIKK